MKQLFTIICVLFLFLSCGSQKKQVEAAKEAPIVKVANFDYSPPDFTRIDSTKVTVILLKPFYINTSGGIFKLAIFKDFSDKMSLDFEELMTAKGFAIKGPYGTVDEVVYTDKKTSDLYLSIEIDLDVNAANAKIIKNSKVVYSYPQSYTKYSYRFKGTLVFNGKINMIVRAVTKSGFGDKLSVKSIPINQKEIFIDSYSEYPDDDIIRYFSNDPGMQNPLVDALNEYYTTIFNKAWNYVDPMEYKEFKKLSDEINGRN